MEQRLRRDASAFPIRAVTAKQKGQRERMVDSAGFNYSLEGLATRIKNSNLEVPVYQRSYAWNHEQVEDYWGDLFSSFSDGANDYFMGTLVIKSRGGNGRETIIDGQQRLATTMILLASIRNAFRVRNDDTRAKSIQSDYISTTDLGSASEISKLFMNSEDRIYFQRCIVDNDENITASKKSHELIMGAKLLFTEKLEDYIAESGQSWTANLTSLVEYLKEKLIVMVIVVSSDADAFLIFETLNDRGADLTLADLLKNYLFGRATDEHLEAVKHNWISAVGALESCNENAVLTKFLRHHWSSFQGLVREKALYSSIKNKVKTPQQTLEFSDVLCKSADTYAAILNANHPFWDSFDKTTKSNLETLLRLRIEQNRPLLLSVLSCFSTNEIKRTLKRIVSWGVRGLVVGGVGGGQYEKVYCDAAAKIRNGTITNSDELLGILAPIVPSDTAFRRAFETVEVAKGVQARYYLASIERYMMHAQEPELVPNENVDEVNLEHILPKNASDTDWGAHFTCDERSGYLYRLGNQTLMKKTPNRNIGNKPFSAKKIVFAESDFLLTKNVSRYDDWTKDAIEERQKEMATYALEIWNR